MLAPTQLSDDSKDRLRRLAWRAVSGLALSFVSAAGEKLGERLVDWMLGRDDKRDEDEDDDEDDGEDEEGRTPVIGV